MNYFLSPLTSPPPTFDPGREKKILELVAGESEFIPAESGRAVQ